eukprot:g80077.t1
MDGERASRNAWTKLRDGLPTLKPAALKLATEAFPPRWRVEYEAPILFASPITLASEMSIMFDEAKLLVERACDKTLQNNGVKLGNEYFFVTTVHPRSFYAKSAALTPLRPLRSQPSVPQHTTSSFADQSVPPSPAAVAAPFGGECAVAASSASRSHASAQLPDIPISRAVKGLVVLHLPKLLMVIVWALADHAQSDIITRSEKLADKLTSLLAKSDEVE